MKLKAFLIMTGLWMGLFGLTACGGADVRTYQYPETSVLFDDFHIQKTVYSPGVMKLYYRGGQLKDNPIRCYDANFEELGDQFDHTFRNGVLTIQADFAEQISGLMIEDRANDVVYHLRYLDSSQFAWLADVFWYDDGWCEMGDREAYYSAAELQAEADRKAESQKAAQEAFALLEGTWVTENGLQKYEFSANGDSGMDCCNMWWNSEAQRWDSWRIFAETAFQTKGFGALLEFNLDCDADCDYDKIEEKAEKLIAITLINSDHAAANMQVLYDSEENVIKDTDAIYYKQ